MSTISVCMALNILATVLCVVTLETSSLKVSESGLCHIFSLGAQSVFSGLLLSFKTRRDKTANEEFQNNVTPFFFFLFFQLFHNV